MDQTYRLFFVFVGAYQPSIVSFHMHYCDSVEAREDDNVGLWRECADVMELRGSLVLCYSIRLYPSHIREIQGEAE